MQPNDDSPFDPNECDGVQRVRRYSTGLIGLSDHPKLLGEESIIVRLNDTIYRFDPQDIESPKDFADGIYAAIMEYEKMKVHA